ncbi:ABC transporter permease [Bacillus badius]|uniref:Multidrug ABC transporter permease n=1 Tax=Bacillus badius TaxID=1455 RepID=A0ABR5ARI4_BACBA|nr:ABC transporter permease [Bacillus badius]KIL77294.1 hypothetical protein SD77_1537 [Bacillus badius]MED4718205.1 ABC transporter permease [Bacillus badius]
MKSGILSFNKGLFQQHVRSVLWISIFFVLALLIILPLGMWMVFLNTETPEELLPAKGKNGLLHFFYGFQYVTFLVFPVITGLVLTSYMTKKGSSDFMNSLPFKRETLLTHVYAAGGAALTLPVVLNGIVMLLIRPFIKLPLYTISDVFSWMGLSLVIILLLFAVTVFVGLFIGSTLLQGVMAYGIFILPGALIMLVLSNARFFVNGLAADAYIENVFQEGIFLIRGSLIENKPFSGLELTLYIALIVVLVAVSYFVYKIRPAEAVDETIAFPFFRSLFIFSLTLMAMLTGGLYFAEFLDGAFGWTMFGCLIGAFAGYTIMQMIVQKTLRLAWPWKGFVLYIAALLVLLVPTVIFANIYEKKVPEENEVTSVYIGDHFFDNASYIPDSVAIDKAMTGELKERESIQQAISLHKQLVKKGKPSRQRGYPVGIKYKLKDGSQVQRHYYVESKQLAGITEEIRNNPEFKRKSNPLFTISRPEKISYLTVVETQATRQLRVTEQKEMMDLLQMMKNDALNETSPQFKEYDFSYVGEVQVWFTDGEMLSVPIYLGQEQTVNYIRQKVKGGSSFASAEQVLEAYILTTDTEERRQQFIDYMNENSFVDQASPLGDFPVPAQQVKDPAQLKKLLDPANLSDEDSSKKLLVRWRGNKEVSAVGIRE